MDPSPQRVRTGDRPPRPRNLAAGCLSLLVIALALGLCSRGLQEIEEQGNDPVDTTTTSPASP